MTLTSVSPKDAHALMAQGAMLVDIRPADEHAREHIAAARHVPMDALSRTTLAAAPSQAVIFHCRSGNRTQAHATTLADAAPGQAYLLDGGLDAWKRAGLPVVADRSQPLELQRQVQITAGTLIALGYLLGVTISPAFHLLSGVIGAGLIFAGVSGYCGMARVLMKMPWNRRAPA